MGKLRVGDRLIVRSHSIWEGVVFIPQIWEVREVNYTGEIIAIDGDEFKASYFITTERIREAGYYVKRINHYNTKLGKILYR